MASDALSATRRAPTRWWVHVAVVGGYIAVSLVFWARVWITGHPSSAITCACGDAPQGAWWMAWTAWALRYGHNPLLTNAIFARSGGVNVLSNTSTLAPAFVLTPVTLVFGPVFSFNLAQLLAPALSGWGAFAAAGRFTRLLGARIVAGALYGFSPFIVRNMEVGHLQLTALWYPPLALLLVMKLIDDDGASPARIGVGLGALTVVQFFVGLEVLALTVAAGVVALVVTAIAWPRAVWRRRRRIAVTVGAGGAVAIVALAYPVWWFLAGPRHVVGPPFPVSSAAAGLTVNPGAAHSGNALERLSGYLGSAGPPVEYLGWPLLIALAVSARWWRRRRVGLVLGVTAVALWVYSLQPPGPLRALARLPLVSSIMPPRVSLIVGLIVAMLVALSIDGWWAVAATRATGRARDLVRAGVVVSAGVALVPLAATYSVPLVVSSPAVPAWFTDAPATAHPPVALVIPYSNGLNSVAMYWQAESGLHVSLLAAWAFVPGGDHRHDQGLSPIGGAVPILSSLSGVRPGPPPALTPAAVATVRAALARWAPLDVVVVRGVPDDAAAAGWLTAAIGTAPTFARGVWSWRITSLPPARAVSPARYATCVHRGASAADPMAIPDCVLGAA